MSVNGPVRRFFGVAAFRWELSFHLRVTQGLRLCWEPGEGVAAVCFFHSVGNVGWRRGSHILTANGLWGATEGEPPASIPPETYKVTAMIEGRELPFAEVHGGNGGGFDEVQPYTTAHIFLLLRTRGDFSLDATDSRAAECLNNVLRAHAFVTGEGHPTNVHPAIDVYSLSASLGVIPSDWPQMSATDVLRRLPKLPFGTEIGHGRHTRVGIGSADDLARKPLSEESLAVFDGLIQAETRLEVYQELFLSAIRRFRLADYPFAVIDAESAVEVCIAQLLRRALVRRGQSEQQVQKAFEGPLGSLQQKINQIDAIAGAEGHAGPRFDSSDAARN